MHTKLAYVENSLCSAVRFSGPDTGANKNTDRATDEAYVIHVLLIEDNPGDARLVREWLRDAEPDAFELHGTQRLQEALTVAKQRLFDVALLDLSLPDSQGLESLRRLQAAMPTLPVVVLSGLHDEALALQAVRQGAQDYLVKGDDHGPTMARALRYAIERRRVEEELRRARDELEEHVAERTAALRATNRRLSDEITERRHAERFLRRERDFTNAVIDTLAALVVVLDRRGCIVRFNRACEEMTGLRAQDVVGSPMWERCVPAEEQGAVRDVFLALLEAGHSLRNENHWHNARGEKKLIAWSSSVLRDEHGDIEYVIGTGIDITEQRRVEELAAQRQNELAHVARLSTMGQMATEIAHELNQPLFAIASYADACLRLYRRHAEVNDEVAAGLEELVRQAARAGKVVQRVRRFVRKEAPHSAPVELTRLLRDMAQLIAVEARAHQVNIALALAPSDVWVMGDSVLIEQVVLNLTRNAIEAMDVLPVERRRLTISTFVNANMVEVAVSDAGPGLNAEQREQIFRPFYTTKSQGMGMGLSISRSIIEAHGGQLSATVNGEGGTTFSFVLPIRANKGEEYGSES
jgi:PAS domain S-box-containing protein